ncbi:retrovirus-related pol polyprotein from transposon TNT 1-94 [Tanacetum coccineum]
MHTPSALVFHALSNPVLAHTNHPSPSSPRSPISSSSSVLHLSPTFQTSTKSSNGQSSPVSTTSIPKPPPPPPITWQRPTNLCQNPKQRVPYNPSANHATVLSTTITEPTSFTVANNSPEWRQAMKEELKRDKNGVITHYKARFVAKGFRQQPCIDFHETFSPVVKSTTIRAVLSLAVTNNWPLRQLDVHNAFLHGNIKKRALHAWFEHLSKALFDLGFKGSKTDPSLFIYSPEHTLLYILVYVDDIIVTGNNKGTIDNIISQLGSAFALKDLRPLNYFLGIEIVSHVSDILLSQKKHILELLQSVGLSNCNPVSSPMVTLSSLTFAVNKVCQYMHAPTENHWSAVKRILCYLHGTIEHGMLIHRSSGSTLQAFTDVLWKGNPDNSLEAFSDADWAGDSDDRRSTGDLLYIFVQTLYLEPLANNVRFHVPLQKLNTKPLLTPLLSLHGFKLFFISLVSVHLQLLYYGVTILVQHKSPNPIFCVRTKHVKIEYHFVWEKVAQGDLRVQHISTHDQIADIFTKVLPTPRFLFLRSKLHVVAVLSLRGRVRTN